ncbi:MAG: pseudouridine synthase [Clostridiales bacterium]|nr:MAG: pseudouridine synthase [Clostridiales bacterium]
MPSQEDESKDPDILSILKNYLKETYDKPGDAYLGLVHRLDRVTGGVMVFAKKRQRRRQDFRRQSVKASLKKTYLAVVYDTPKGKKQAVLVNHLKKRIRKSNTVRVVPEVTEGAKICGTYL